MVPSHCSLLVSAMLNLHAAACWHFAEQLTDYMEANNEPIIPLGLIGSHWGGTMVEMWQPNRTLNAQVCKNDTGGDWAPWQLGRWDIGGGGLFNGMVLPYVNMTIKGALCESHNKSIRGQCYH